MIRVTANQSYGFGAESNTGVFQVEFRQHFMLFKMKQLTILSLLSISAHVSLGQGSVTNATQSDPKVLNELDSCGFKVDENCVKSLCSTDSASCWCANIIRFGEMCLKTWDVSKCDQQAADKAKASFSASETELCKAQGISTKTSGAMSVAGHTGFIGIGTLLLSLLV